MKYQCGVWSVLCVTSRFTSGSHWNDSLNNNNFYFISVKISGLPQKQNEKWPLLSVPRCLQVTHTCIHIYTNSHMLMHTHIQDIDICVYVYTYVHTLDNSSLVKYTIKLLLVNYIPVLTKSTHFLSKAL